jgi:hypothetical protein
MAFVDGVAHALPSTFLELGRQSLASEADVSKLHLAVSILPFESLA